MNNVVEKKKTIKYVKCYLIALIILITVVMIKPIVKFINDDSKIRNEEKEKIDINNNISNNIGSRDLSINNEYLILVNKENSLNEYYVPDDLVIPNIRLNTANNMVEQMRKEAAEELENMFVNAEKNGIYLIGISGYRSFDYQQSVYESDVSVYGKEYTDKYVAYPGKSEHQTGLTMDVLSDEYGSLDEGFENTMAYKWITENCSDYGFIIRYPKGKESITGYNYEPWHLRYVGKEAAQEINERGITLEEYLS